MVCVRVWLGVVLIWLRIRAVVLVYIPLSMRQKSENVFHIICMDKIYNVYSFNSIGIVFLCSMYYHRRQDELQLMLASVPTPLTIEISNLVLPCPDLRTYRKHGFKFVAKDVPRETR